MASSDPNPDPQTAAWAPETGQLSVFDVVDVFDQDYYGGKALELILQHPQDPAAHAENLRQAQLMLDEKIRRLIAAARRYQTGGQGSQSYFAPGGPASGQGSSNTGPTAVIAGGGGK